MSIEPGKGYRLLEYGELLEDGDQFRTMYDSWVNVSSGRIGTVIQFACEPHRRKLSKATGIEAIVCADIAERQRLGVAKYGTSVKDSPLTAKQWAQHAYEECLDQAVYLRRLIDEL